MICAVYVSWFSKRDATWSPCHIRVVDVIDGDIQRVARSLAKSYGKLEDCTFTPKGDAVVFKTRRISLKTLCNQYEKDKSSFSETYPDWFCVIDCLGVDAIKALGFRKDRVLAAYEISSKTQEIDVKALLYNSFKVGKTYSKKFIVEFLEGKGIENPKSTIVKNYFKVTETTVKGAAAYRIDSKKKDFKS